MCTVKEIQEAIREDCKSQHDMDSTDIDRVMQTLPFAQEEPFNSVYRFFLQQLQKRLLEHHLRIAFPCIHLLHIEPLQKSLQRKATLRQKVLLFFQLYGKC